MAVVESSSPANSPFPRDGNGFGWLQAIHPAGWALIVFLLILPAFGSNFVLVQIFGRSFILGMIALSLMFLAGYGGMVSLVQMTVAGCAG